MPSHRGAFSIPREKNTRIPRTPHTLQTIDHRPQTQRQTHLLTVVARVEHRGGRSWRGTGCYQLRLPIQNDGFAPVTQLFRRSNRSIVQTIFIGSRPVSFWYVVQKRRRATRQMKKKHDGQETRIIARNKKQRVGKSLGRSVIWMDE